MTDLAITGDAAGNLLAVQTSNGKIVWHENIGRMGGAPVTVEIDGKHVGVGSFASARILVTTG